MIWKQPGKIFLTCPRIPTWRYTRVTGCRRSDSVWITDVGVEGDDFIVNVNVSRLNAGGTSFGGCGCVISRKGVKGRPGIIINVPI